MKFLGLAVALLSLSSGESPIGGNDWVSLAEWTPLTMEQAATLGIKVLRILEDLHSRERFFKVMLPEIFLIQKRKEGVDFNRVKTSEVADQYIYTSNEAWTNRLNNIEAFRLFLVSLLAKDRENLIPMELSLMYFRAKQDLLSDNVYTKLIQLLKRMLPLPQRYAQLSRFQRLMTLWELNFHTSVKTGSNDDCVRRWITLHNGGRHLKVTKSRWILNGNAKQWYATNMKGSLVQVKVWTNWEKVPEPIHREKAIISTLRGIDGIPKLLEPIEPVRNHCHNRMVVVSSPMLTKPLSEISKPPVAFAIHVAIAGLGLLQDLHESGIIHGAMSLDQFHVSSSKPMSLRLIDFNAARPWAIHGGVFPKIDEPLMRKSIFELDGSPVNRRDDLYRFAELLLVLLREPEFITPPVGIIKSPAAIAQFKRARRITATRNLPTCFITFLNAVTLLKEDENPPYTQWIAEFKEKAEL